MGKNNRPQARVMLTNVEVDESVPTLITAGIKLLVTSQEFAKGESKTFTLVATNASYQFDDVSSIELKTPATSVDFAKTSNKAFKLTSKATTSDEAETVTVLVKNAKQEQVEVSVAVTVKETTETVNAVFNKDIVDICPGNEVSFDFTGTDASSVVIESIVDPESALKIDKTRKVLTVTGEGEFVNGVVLKKDSFSKTVYIQASSKGIITVDPTEVSIHMGQTKTLAIELSGDSFEMTSNRQEVCTADKLTKTITPVAAGEAEVTVTGTRGSLTQSVVVPVHIRETIQPTPPEILTKTLVVEGNERLTINFRVAEGDKLSARIDGATSNEKGTILVNLNKIVYSAYAPDEDSEVTLMVKTTSSDEVEGEEVPVVITVKGVPTTILEVAENIEIKEGETRVVEMKTDARSVAFISSVPANMTVNSSTRTITGVNYGSAILTITAQAINCKPVEKQVSVVIKPADLNRPSLKTKVLQVVEEETIKLEFTLDSKATLDLKEASDAGSIEIEGSVATWTAPKLKNADRMVYTFNAVARREEVNVESKDYIFSVTVIKKASGGNDPDVPDNSMSMSDISNIIKDEQLTFTEKMEIIKRNGNAITQDTVNKLLNYEAVMGNNGGMIDETQGAAKNYELFLTIRRVIESTDNAEFQALFSLVNLVFKEYSNSAYKEVKLHRFDAQWAGGNKNLTSYQNIATCICMLCDIMQRSNNLKRVNFGVVFDPEKTIFKEVNAQSVIKYYSN